MMRRQQDEFKWEVVKNEHNKQPNGHEEDAGDMLTQVVSREKVKV